MSCVFVINYGLWREIPKSVCGGEMGAKCVIITTARQTDRQTKKKQGLTQCYVALGVRVDYNQLLGGERERERERERD